MHVLLTDSNEAFVSLALSTVGVGFFITISDVFSHALISPGCLNPLRL